MQTASFGHAIRKPVLGSFYPRADPRESPTHAPTHANLEGF